MAQMGLAWGCNGWGNDRSRRTAQGGGPPLWLTGGSIEYGANGPAGPKVPWVTV